MFRPVSALPYRVVARNAQALLVRRPPGGLLADDLSPWDGRVAACLADQDAANLRDVVRDVLHNPQIRAIVFAHDPACRPAYAAFWAGSDGLKGLDDEHVTMVRQFVDLYDDDFALRGPQQPFSPTRVMYLR